MILELTESEKNSKEILVRREIKSARLASGMTQKQIAQSVGITQNRYSKYEAASCELPFHIVSSLCDLLNIKILAKESS